MMSIATMERPTTDPAGSLEDELHEQLHFTSPSAQLTGGTNISSLHCVTSRVELPLMPRA